MTIRVLDCGWDGKTEPSYIPQGDVEVTRVDLYKRGPGIVAIDLDKPFPLEDGTFDQVFIFSVLEHLWEPRQALSELHRVMVPGGVLTGSMPFLYRYHPDPDDYLRFTGPGLERALTEAGFKSVRVTPLQVGPSSVAFHMIRPYVRPRFIVPALARTMAALDKVLGRFSLNAKTYNVSHYFEAEA